jgi:predicted RNase H-like nuclease
VVTSGGGRVLVVGVDGYPGGWLAVAHDDVACSLMGRFHDSFVDLIATCPEAARIGIDIPIGLAVGPRRCDVEARRLLGPRRASVFPASDPRLLDATTYGEALARARALTGKGISKQAYNIHAKIAEVNRAMTADLQRRVVEVHPEVSFRALAGHPMARPKRTHEGHEERRALLADAFPGLTIPDRATARRWCRPAKADDVLDAIVVAWTARRHATGIAGHLPASPPVDALGRRMEIVF